jgi:hypothetical protein
MGWIIAGSLLVALAGVGMIVFRGRLAEMQAMLAGGNITPGCAVAEGIALILLAVAIVIVER